MDGSDAGSLSTSTMPSSDRLEVLARYRRHVNSGYAKLAGLTGMPVEVRSAGTRVFDADGHEYLDCGGYSVFVHGHCHPDIIAAVRDQLERHPLATRVLLNPQLALAAESLASVAPAGLEFVMFTNSGAEAAEVGLKIARLNGKTRYISTHGGYHGKTFGALSVTGRPKYQEPFVPLVPDVQFIRYGDVDELHTALTADGARSAVLLEPVQGEAGVIIPPPGYLRRVRELCSEFGAFLILDEIQTGMGRLGTWWGADREGIVPDVMLVGKGLSGGAVPVGAAVTTPAAFEPLNRDPLLHSSTFAGNPLAMAAAHAAVRVVERDELVERARILGERLLLELQRILNEHCPAVLVDVRGVGLLIAVEFVAEHIAGDFMLELMNRKVLISHSLNAHRVARITPPAILSDADCDWLLGATAEVARELGKRYANMKAL